MGLQATFVLYLVIGVSVEAALVTFRDDPPVARWFTILTGVLFWPLYVPILLTPPEVAPASTQQPDEPSAAEEEQEEQPPGEPSVRRSVWTTPAGRR